MRLLFLAPLTFLVAGCGVNEDNFAEKYAKVTCSLAFDCELQGYQQFDDEADCRDEMVGVWDDVVGMMEAFGCTVSYDTAGACLRDMRGASCDEMESQDGPESQDCDDMFVCDSFDTGWLL